jgi:hypothetical protein
MELSTIVPIATLAIIAVGTDSAIPVQPIRPYTMRIGAMLGIAHKRPRRIERN